ARRWLERSALQEPKDVPDVLQRSFAHLALGVFDVHVPAGVVRDGKALQEVGTALLALVETQRAFGSWVQGTEVSVPGKEKKEKRKEDALAKWLGGLNPKQFGDGLSGGANRSEE